MKRYAHQFFNAICLIVFIGIWHFLSLGRKTLIFPSPEEVFASMISILRSNVFLPSVYNTVKAVFLSFIAAFIPALVLGILGKFFPFLYRVLDFASGIIRAVPTVSIILIALLLLPVSFTPVIICFFIIFPVLYTNIAEGLTGVDEKLLDMARVYCIPQGKVIRDIYIPSLKNFIAAGSRSALGLGFKIMVTAEVFNFISQNTVGAQMYLHKIQIDLAGIFAWTIIVILLSLLFDVLLKKCFERSVKP